MVTVNHVFIGRGPVKAADLFNILTWVGIGANVNLYVAHPDKRAMEEQHTWESLFNVTASIGDGVSMAHLAAPLFRKYVLVENEGRGIADQVRIINLHTALANHEVEVPEGLRLPTLGWKNGIQKFIESASEWWPQGAKMEGEVLQRVFTAVDATKFYVAATRQGLTCDMKVAPTRYFSEHLETLSSNFISFQRGNASATGFENQLSGSMCGPDAEARSTYATVGRETGNGFGSKSVEEAARYFEKITSAHGKAMQALQQKGLGVDCSKLGRNVVLDPQSGWKGPVCVFKHPTDQTSRSTTLSERDKERAARDISDMATAAMKLVQPSPFQEDILRTMDALRRFPGFNPYA